MLTMNEKALNTDIQENHWSKRKEEAAGYWNVKLILILFRIFPVILMRIIAFPVGFFYYAFSKRARNDSHRYLDNVSASLAADGKKFRGSALAHIIAFALSLIEKVESWGGKVPFKRVHFQHDDIDDLLSRLEKGDGCFLISSHLGNMELLRALAGFNRTGVSREIPVTTIEDLTVTAHFNRMLKELNPKTELRVISVHDIGPDTILLLQERLAAGELVVIAGDRTSGANRSKDFHFPFLGKEAPFAYGPFFLASLMDVPVYTVFALRQKDLSLSSHYDMHIHKSGISFSGKRSERTGRIEELALSFVRQLEGYCKEHPYQWYNFYDFWANEIGRAHV
jgi:predicted LPLAT superfamily acyltransferase